MSRPAWASWPEAAGLSDEQMETMEAISVEARDRGFVGHLPVGDVSAWGPALREAGLDDLAQRAHEVAS